MKKYLAIALLMVMIPLVAPQEKIALQFCFEKGKVYTLYMLTRQKIVQEIQGQKQTIDQTIGMGTIFNVIEKDTNAITTVEIQYKKILFSQEGPQGKIEYDSEKPPQRPHPAAMGFVALAGQSYTILFTREGSVQEIRGVDKMIESMVKKFGMLTPAQKTQLTQNLKQQFGDKALRQQMQGITAIYPLKPVAINESWTKTINSGAPFPMVMDNIWTLKKRNKGIATISVNSKFKNDPQTPYVEMGGMRVKYVITGTQTGTLQMEESSGWTREAKMTQSFTGTLEIRGSTIPMSISSEITIAPFEP